MYCQWCGAELPAGAAKCPKCGKATSSASGPTGTQDFDQIIADAKRAAKDLTTAAAQLTQRLGSKMQAAADDPKGSAHRVARRVAKELDAAREEIEKALREL
jgi:cell division septum initiation protein DivIVA